MTARIVQVSVSQGGVPKLAIDEGRVGSEGIEGDWQRDRRYHGGPERALCLYSLELLDRLRAEGHPVAPGALGENVTTSGLDLSALVPGDRLALGEQLIVQIASHAGPCKTLTHCFVDGTYERISHKRHPGWSRLYARVLACGSIRPGDVVRLLDRPVV